MSDAKASAQGDRRDPLLAALFSRSESQADPTLVLLAGQHGSAPGRAIMRVQEQHSERLAPIVADIVEAFQTDSAVAGAQQPHSSTADSLQRALTHAREHRLSVLLEGPFLSPGTALGVAARFADAGYRVRVVAIGVRPVESLLTATTVHVQQARAGRSSSFNTADAHERSLMALAELLESAERDASVHRVSILDGRGAWAFDTGNGDAGARVSLAATQSERMSSLESMQWLSELRRITEYARNLRTAPTPITEALIALHEAALRRVVPELPVPADSEVVRIQQQRHAAEIATLRATSIRTAEEKDLAAPIPPPPVPSRDGIGI